MARLRARRRHLDAGARRWLAGQRFEHAPTELAYLDYLAAIDGLLARRATLDERLSRIAQDDELWPTVARLRCFRGIETLTALVLCLEIGDFARFQRPAQLAAWLGLVPSLNQSGESETRGGITKTGSGYARRLLVEAAWHFAREPRIGVTLRSRHQGQPEQVIQIAWRAQHRLYRLHRRLRARGKPGNVTVVAAARELACFLWAAASVRQLLATSSLEDDDAVSSCMACSAEKVEGARSSVAPDARRRELGRLLAASDGYHVLTIDGYDVGLVDHIRYERHSDHPDEIVIRRRNVLRKSRCVIPFAAVRSVNPRHRTVRVFG